MDHKSSWKPHFDSRAVTILSSNLIHDGHYRAYIHTLEFRLFKGGKSPQLQREQIQIPPSAAVVLYDPKLDCVVMVEQLRIGALGSEQPWLLEVVAGYLEPGEAPEQAIVREAKEEAQCEIKKLLPICHYYTSPGGLTERTWVFCGLIDASDVSGIHGCKEEHEDIKVHVLPALEVMALLQQGLLTSSSTVIALQWLQANRAQLQSVNYL